jgi:hypothetical protein
MADSASAPTHKGDDRGRVDTVAQLAREGAPQHDGLSRVWL